MDRYHGETALDAMERGAESKAPERKGPESECRNCGATFVIWRKDGVGGECQWCFIERKF